MKMDMKDRLPGIPSVVDDQAIPTLVQSPTFSNVSGDKEKMSNKIAVPFTHALYVRDMFIGHDQDVRRRLRIDVFKCNRHLVVVHELRRDLAINDLAKKAVRIMIHDIVLP